MRLRMSSRLLNAAIAAGADEDIMGEPGDPDEGGDVDEDVDDDDVDDVDDDNDNANAVVDDDVDDDDDDALRPPPRFPG